MKRVKNIGFSFIFIAFLFIITSFNTIINFITDYKWFQEIGYNEVFLTKLMTQFKIGIPVFIIFIVCIYAYLMMLKRAYHKKIHTAAVGMTEKRINQIAMLASAVVAFMASITVSGNLWFDILTFFNTTKFNLTDPIFNKDISFYMFKLPLIQEIYYLAIGFIIVLTVITMGFYLFMLTVRRPTLFEVNSEYDEETTNIRNFHKKMDMQNGRQLLELALNQLVVLGVILLVILGLGYILKTYDLLYSTRGVAYGASYTDVKVTLWVYRIMIIMSLVSAVFLTVGLALLISGEGVFVFTLLTPTGLAFVDVAEGFGLIGAECAFFILLPVAFAPFIFSLIALAPVGLFLEVVSVFTMLGNLPTLGSSLYDL